MATIRDVAQRADVSIATVSNFLNHTKPVSRAASARIKEAIEELQYTQNLSAKCLKTNSYNDIAVVLPNFNDPYYVQIFQGIEYVFQNSSFFLNLAFSYDIPELELNIVRNMLRKQVCGLILITCRPDDWKFYYENFSRHNRPVVLIDRAIRGLDASFVSFDNRMTLCHMTRELLEMNYRKITLLSGPEQYTCEAACVQGFLDAWREANLTPGPDALLETEINKEDAFRKTTSLLTRVTPEIILATSELTASGIIEGLRFLGHTSDGIQVVTLGEEHWNKYTHSFASFSSARPAMKMGEKSARLLIEKLRSPQLQESEQVILQDNIAADLPQLEERLARGRSEETDRAERRIRVLMLDTPMVHTFCGLLRNFEIQTGIRTESSILPHHNLYDTIVQSHVESDPEKRYDVYMYDIPWLSMLASQGVLEDITDRLTTIDVSAFLPGCLQYFSEFQKRFYGVPFMYAPQILYYRKDLFDDLTLKAGFERAYGSALRPPLTFKEFNAVAEFFTNQTSAISYGISVPAAYDECLAPELYMRLRAYGSSIIDRRGSVLFDSPQTLRAYINFVRSIRIAKPDYLKANDVSIVEDFLRGETAMLISYPAFMSNVTDLRKNSMIGSIGYSYIPGKSPLLGGWSFGVSSRSAQKDAAFEFIKWTCNEQMGNYFALLGGQQAITRTYTNDELVKLYPWLPLYQSAYRYTKPMLPPVNRRGQVVSPNAIDAIVCKWVYRMILQNEDIQQVITGTQQELTEFMASGTSLDNG